MISSAYSWSIILVNMYSQMIYDIKEKFKMVAALKELTYKE